MADNVNQNIQPNDPTTTKVKPNPTNSSGVPVVVKPNKAQVKQNNAMTNSVDPYANYGSEKVLRESGTIRSLGENYVDNPYGSEYFKSKFWGADMGAVSNTGGDFVRGANPFNQNYDFEHDRREGQSTVGAGVGILNQFVAKTAINTAGGILAGFYGIGSIVANDWDTSKLWDNSVARGFDKATEWADENNSVFTSEYARSQQGALNIFNVEGMKNLGDGMSFVAGAVLSEVAMVGLTGGVGNAIKGTSWGLRAANAMSKAGKLTTAQMGKLMSHANDIALGSSSLAKTGEAIKRAASMVDDIAKAGLSKSDDFAELSRVLGVSSAEDMVKFQQVNNFITALPKNARSIVTGTFWESGLEARQGKDDFYSSQMEIIDNELALRTDLSDQQKAEERARREKVVQEMSNDVGGNIFALNTMVLQASNMIQYPSLFGRPKLLDKATGYISDVTTPFKKIGSALSDNGYKLKKLAKAGVIAKNAGRILKKPLTEGLEEMTQSSISDLVTTYYEDQLSTEYQQQLLFGEFAEFAYMSSNSMAGRTLTQLGDTFTNEDAYKEGVIGAVMGFIGAPSFRRNANGKIRPHIAGGVWEDIKSAKEDYKSLGLNLSVLNSQKGDLTSILGLNEHQAIINKKMAAKDDLAQLTGNEIQLHENQETNISNHVIRMNKLGLQDQIDESIKDIESLSIEEYRKAFNKGEEYTEDDKSADVKMFKDTTKRYNDAYKVVNNALNLDTVSSNSTLEKMINVLVHGVGFEKYLNQQREALINDPKFIEALANNGMTQEDIDNNIKASYDFKALHKTFQDTITSLSKDKVANHKTKLDNLELELENLLESLPTEVRSAARNLLSVKESGESSKIDESVSQLETVMNSLEGETSEIVIDTLNRYTETRKELNEGLNQLNSKTIEEWALSEDPEKVKAAKKEMDDAIERMNKSIQEQYDKDTKGFVKTNSTEGPKKFKYEDVLSYLKANKQLDDLETYLRNAEENIDLNELLNGDFKTVKDFKSRLHLLENKRLSTVQLARDLIKMGGSRAYHKINIDSFNYGMKELNFVMANLEYAVDTNNENELTVQTVTLKDLVAKMREKADKLLEEKAVTEKDLNESMDVLKRAEELLKDVGDLLEKKIIQEVAADKTDDAARKDSIESDLLVMNPLGQQNIPGINPDTKVSETGDPVSKQPGENNEDGEVSEEEKANLSTIAARDLNEIDAEVNETSISAISPKLLFTINPKALPEEGKIIKDSDINHPDNTDPQHSLRYKIDNGKIKYNSGGEFIIPETDPLNTEDAESFSRVVFGVPTANRTQEQIDSDKASYLSGLEKIKGENGAALLDVPFDQMDPDVKFYIANTRVIQKYYDKQVGIDEITGEQYLNVDENTDIAHTSYLYAATLAHDVSEINKERKLFERQIAEAKEKHLDKLSKLKDSLDKGAIDPETYQKGVKQIEDDTDYNIQNITKGFDSLLNGKNDFVNFSIRLNAIKAALNGEKAQFRVGNFLYGEIDPAARTGKDLTGNLVDVFPLTSDNIEDNPLFTADDPFSIDKLAYVDQSGDLRSFKTNKIVKTNTGSPLVKTYLVSGRVYGLSTLKNGHVIPVALNTERLGRDIFEPMMDEIVEIMKYYTEEVHVDKTSPNKVINLKDDTLFGYAKGMTYRQFFSSIANTQRSSNRNLLSDLGGFINFKGDTGQLTVGEKTLLDKGTEVDENGTNIYDIARGIIGNGRFRVSRNAMFKTDKTGKVDYDNINQDYIDFILNNNLLNHTVTTNDPDKVERLFTPVKDKDGNPVPIRPQIHLLNSENVKGNNAKKSFSTDKKRIVYALLFGKGKINNDKLKEDYTSTDIIKGLYTNVGGKLIKEMMVSSDMTEDQKLEKLKLIVDDLIKEKINFAYEIFRASPNLFSDFGMKVVGTKGDLEAINKLKLPVEGSRTIMDQYLFTTLKELRKMTTTPKMTQTVINYASNIGLAREFRELLLTGSNTTLESFKPVEAVSERTKAKYTIFKKSEGQLGPTDISSYKFQIDKINLDIEKLETQMKAVKGTIDESGVKTQLDALIETKKDLVEKRIQETKGVIKHILIVGNTMESVYNIEKLFGGSKYVPNFQFNHSTMKGFNGKANKPKVYRYNMDESGNPIPLKGTDTVLENGSLIVNNKRGPFTLEFKTSDKNLITNDINDIDKIVFDENGEPKNANLMVTTITMKSKDELEKQKADNANKKKEDQTNFTYNIGTAAIIQGSDMDNKHVMVINELALPGLNADRTIDLEVQQQLINIANQYGANNMSFRENIESLTDYFKLKPTKDFGNLGELNSNKAKDVAQDNKTSKAADISDLFNTGKVAGKPHDLPERKYEFDTSDNKILPFEFNGVEFVIPTEEEMENMEDDVSYKDPDGNVGMQIDDHKIPEDTDESEAKKLESQNFNNISTSNLAALDSFNEMLEILDGDSDGILEEIDNLFKDGHGKIKLNDEMTNKFVTKIKDRADSSDFKKLRDTFINLAKEKGFDINENNIC